MPAAIGSRLRKPGSALTATADDALAREGAGAPGDSAMPEWERFLSNEEMWEVILFLYDHTSQRPRAREEQ